MIQNIFFFLVGGAGLLALFRWRWGPFLMILVGLIQDPVRKITPGAPGYLVLSAAIVWAATVVGAFVSGDVSWEKFRRRYDRLSTAIAVFAILIIPAALRSAMYAPGSWQITAIGLFIYGSFLVGMMVGETYPRGHDDIPRLLGFYAICGSVTIVGALLQKSGVVHPALGTASMGHHWVTYRTGGAVHMMSGFFRSPDVLGWHATTAIMAAIILTIVTTSWRRVFWAGVAVWSSLGILVCARRKMLAMLPIFVLTILILQIRHGRIRHLWLALVSIVVIVAGGLQLYTTHFSDEYSDRFYHDTLISAHERIVQHGWNAVRGTYEQAGFFGYGVGMATQGTQHIAVARPHVWQEGGPGKLLAELGVIGTAGFLGLALVLFGSILDDLTRVSNTSLYPIYSGLTGILLANVGAGIVSAQVFGDPFIAAMLSFFAGLLLSAARVRLPRAHIESMPSRRGPAPISPLPAQGCGQ